MAEFVFTSPGAKFAERDLTYVTKNVGVTTLGLVGETLKGPAFEPVFIKDKKEFSNRFGAQSIKRFNNGELQYQLPYVANSYLSESSQLWVTRVLGLSGYDAGTAWAVTVSAGIDPDTIVKVLATSGTDTFTGNTYLGTYLNTSGDTGIFSTGYTKTGTNFSQTIVEFTASTAIVGGSGSVSTSTYTLTGSELTEYEDMVVAVIRSRGDVVDVVDSPSTTNWDTDTLTIDTSSASDNNMFGEFTLTATKGNTVVDYIVSLDPNSSNYLPNVIGRTADDKKSMIWVESIYPDLIKKLYADGYGWGVKDLLEFKNVDSFTNYKEQFKTPETPWVVSQLHGSEIDRLFKFICISDGNSANSEIKISITNINPALGEFDVVIRSFNDTDDNPIVLEQYNKCNLIENSNGFIGRKIGTNDGEHSLNSEYVMVEIADNIPSKTFPAGFEGYRIKDYSSNGGVSPKLFYKTKYLFTDRPKKTYLGISEKGYSANNLTGTGINQNLFNYNGNIDTGFINSKGFHLDSGVTDTYNGFEFEVGDDEFRTYQDIEKSNVYGEINTRKFTFVPAGGFDGWDVNRKDFGRSHGDNYGAGGIYDGVDVVLGETPVNDFQAWEMAVNTFSNPEDVTINIFATPGINWLMNSILIRNTLEMIEVERTDSLYVIDSPNYEVETTIDNSVKPDIRASKMIVDDLEEVDLDSSYACTYFPWIQVKDTYNNANIYIPPTGEVIRSMAYTDNIAYPWYAPAGLNRGVINARKSKYRLSLEARDILYEGKINPIADFADVGTAIFGQKTLQTKDSALNRINVRRLLLEIKVLISNIAVRLLFDQNDQSTIDQFLSKTNPILENIRSERGLLDFRVKMDDTNNTPETMDRNELYGEIFLKPTRSLEYIGITFTITPSGASFDD